MRTASISQTIGRIKSRNGREAARVWALERGYDVRWTRDGITVKPIG
jgi:hypothetical protein